MAIDPNLDPKTLEDALTLLREISDIQTYLAKIREEKGPDAHAMMMAQIELARQLVTTYSDQTAALQKLIEKRQELVADEETTELKKKQYKKEIERLQNLKTISENIADADKKKVKDAVWLTEKLSKQMLKARKYTQQYNLSTEVWNKTMLDSADGLGLVKTAQTLATAAFTGAKHAVNEVEKELAVLATVMPNVSFTAFKAEMTKMFVAYDNSFRGIMKAGYSFQKDMEQIFAASLDPIAGREMTGMGETQSRMLTRLGIKAEHSSKAFIALKKNAMFFTRDNIEDNKVFTAEVVNLYAGLQQLGVTAEQSSQSFDIFSKVLKETPRTALKSTKRLIKIAESLDISTGKAFQDFNKLMPNLSMYGQRAVEVFGELAAQARATGIEVGGLAKLAEGLDTFKGAAKAAQGLNAVLNGTFISVTDLASADPAEKINIIRRAFAQAGVDFSTAHRRVKQVVASILGRDIATVSRIFGSEEDYRKVSGGLDTAAASSEEIKKKLLKQMTSAERLKRGLQDLNGGIAKVVRTSRKFADKASTLLTNTFNAVGTSVDSADAKVLGFAASLGLIAGIAKARTKLTMAASATAILAAMNDEQKEAVMNTIAEEGKSIYELSKEALLQAIDEVGKAGSSLFDNFFSSASGVTNDKRRRDLAKAFGGGRGASDDALALAVNKLTKELRSRPVHITNVVKFDEDEGSVLHTAVKKIVVDVLREYT